MAVVGGSSAGGAAEGAVGACCQPAVWPPTAHAPGKYLCAFLYFLIVLLESGYF